MLYECNVLHYRSESNEINELLAITINSWDVSKHFKYSDCEVSQRESITCGPNDILRLDCHAHLTFICSIASGRLVNSIGQSQIIMNCYVRIFI